MFAVFLEFLGVYPAAILSIGLMGGAFFIKNTPARVTVFVLGLALLIVRVGPATTA